jgi:hypothetical protein
LISAIAGAWLFASTSYAVRMQNYSIAFFTLFLALYWLLVWSWIRLEMRRTFFDPQMAWFQGLPRAVPGVECEIEGVDCYRVSRLDEDGVFVFTPSEERAGALEGWLESRTGSAGLRIAYKDRTVECRGFAVTRLDRGSGAGRCGPSNAPEVGGALAFRRPPARRAALGLAHITRERGFRLTAVHSRFGCVPMGSGSVGRPNRRMAGIDAAQKGLEKAIKIAAKDIFEKYIAPPHTTDFAIMFLPTEGLFAEVVRRPGLVDSLQRDFKVLVSGPTTLMATLTSLRMGFRTLAIQQRSSEVWQVLSKVKQEFEKFGGVLKKVEDKLDQAKTVVQQARTRENVLGRQLRAVETLPGSAPIATLPFAQSQDLLDDMLDDEAEE